MLGEGNISKMHTNWLEDSVEYKLPMGDQLIPMNELIGQDIRFEFDGVINCIDCGRKTKKSFSQGFCYPCFQNSPMNSECIIKPELCRGHLGEGRDVEWEQKHHVQPHYVYLALSSGLKVGITRDTQIPTRWIDQGARKAIILAETPNRYLCGMIEVALKGHMSDKTNWQKMLKNIIDEEHDLVEAKNKAKDLLPDDLKQYVLESNNVKEIHYPVPQYPTKVKSMTFDKMPVIEGRLCGIKGQYLIFDEGRVLNLRKHTGYFLKLSKKEQNLLF